MQQIGLSEPTKQCAAEIACPTLTHVVQLLAVEDDREEVDLWRCLNGAIQLHEWDILKRAGVQTSAPSCMWHPHMARYCAPGPQAWSGSP